MGQLKVVNIDGQQPFNDWATFVEKKATMQCGRTQELEEIFKTD